MIAHAPLDGAGKSYTAGGEAVCRKRLGAIADDRFGDLHLHMQPNSWFHMLSTTRWCSPCCPSAGQDLPATTWLVHEDAVEGVDYDVPTLTHVWKRHQRRRTALSSPAPSGVCRIPATSPGPYSEVEGDVEAFVNWYITRVSAHLSR